MEKKLVGKGAVVRSNPELYAKTHDFSKARKAGLWLFLKIVFFSLLHKEVEINETLIQTLCTMTEIIKREELMFWIFPDMC